MSLIHLLTCSRLVFLMFMLLLVIICIVDFAWM